MSSNHFFAQAAKEIQEKEAHLAYLKQEVVRKQQLLFFRDPDFLHAHFCEESGDLDQAYDLYFALFERIMESEPSLGNAYLLSRVASFWIRNFPHEEEESIAEALDYCSKFSQVEDSILCEIAAFQAFSLEDSHAAQNAFHRAREIFPHDVQLLCNYARFVDSVLVQEAVEDGVHVDTILDLKAFARTLYGNALQVNPVNVCASVNLSALLVEHSRTRGDDDARHQSLQEARALLQAVLGSEENNDEKAMVHYNLACICGLLGLVSECQQSLQSALELDPTLVEAIKQDDDLESIRREPFCQDLLAKYKKLSSSTRRG